MSWFVLVAGFSGGVLALVGTAAQTDAVVFSQHPQLRDIAPRGARTTFMALASARRLAVFLDPKLPRSNRDRELGGQTIAFVGVGMTLLSLHLDLLVQVFSRTGRSRDAGHL